MHNLMFYRPFALAVVITSLLSSVQSLPLIEHTGFVEVPPHDDVYYFLRVSSEFTGPLLVWLGHTPEHSIGYQLNDSAIPPFKHNLNILMIDLPGVGKTISNRDSSVESLTNFLRISIAYIKQLYSNYTFDGVLVGGEKYMTPLAVSLAEELKASKENVTGLVLGNPYLEARLSIPRRLQMLKHFGLLDVEKEDLFNFFNDLCMKNASLSGCSRIDKLFDMVTNKSEHLTVWSEKYISSILSKSNYLSEFASLLQSNKYNVLLYSGQLDLHSGFNRIYSALQHFAVCESPEPSTYYSYEDSIKGFYKQNACWTLLEVYNASANVTHSQPEAVGKAIAEFIEKGKLTPSYEKGDMQNEIKRYMPNCTLQDWTSGKYYCTCTNGKYGVNCSIELEEKAETDIHKEYLGKSKVAYAKFVVSGSGYLSLEKDNENCTVDIYANLYSASDSNALDLPNDKAHEIHTRKGKIYVAGEENKETVIMLKLRSPCKEIVTIWLKYYKEKTKNILLYWILAVGVILAVTLLIIAMVLVQRKICQRRSSDSLLEIPK